jgi:phenylacetic acid degradation operon negative regulatory protein
LLTILGELALPNGGAIWTSTIVDGLGLLDVHERNSRQAVARLSDQGLVRAERHGRLTRWHLTAPGTSLLERGAERIYGFGRDGAEWDERWLVVLASVPEDQRAKRHQLRSQLEFAGFGFIGPGVAVSPHVERERDANAVLRDLGLEGTAVVLLAETGSFVPDTEIIRRSWDLGRLGDDYRAFVDEFERRHPTTDEALFAALVELVHAWRRFPFADPEIPPALLPAGWPGHPARELFDACHAAWSPGAQRWFRDHDTSS